jgi:D-alanine-D-alanine ligase
MIKLTKKTHIAVLFGGWSAEREVSLNTGKGVVEALRRKGYTVTAIDVTHDIAKALLENRPDVVFNALHGRFGEDGCVQGLLEMLSIPYTHSGVLASALAMDKAKAKIHCAAAGIPVAEGRVVTREEVLAGDVMSRPYILKPIDEGSSVGVHIFHEGGNSRLTQWDYASEMVLAERYIKGREIQVAVLDGKALGAIEIRPKGAFYDYEAKYTDGMAEHLMPAPIHPLAYQQVLTYAETAHRVLGCQGLTRSDFLYDDAQGEPGALTFLETNTQPGMTALSLSPEIAAHAGIAYDDLCERLLKIALRT